MWFLARRPAALAQHRKARQVRLLHPPPRLHTHPALPHHHRVGASAAALSAAELQILERTIAATTVHDRL